MFHHLFENPNMFGLPGGRGPVRVIDVGYASTGLIAKTSQMEREAKLRSLQKRLSLARVQGNKHLTAELEKEIAKLAPKTARYRPM